MKFNLLSLIHAFILGAIIMGFVAGYNYNGLILGCVCLVISLLSNIDSLRDLNS